MKPKPVMLASILAVLAFSPVATATPIGPVYGTVYNGGTFTIQLIGSPSTGANGTTYDIRFVADLSNFTGDDGTGQQDYLFGIGFMPNPGNFIAAESWVTWASVEEAAGWTFKANELSANGCKSGNDSFSCYSMWTGTSMSGAALTTQTGATYRWDFHLTYADPVDLNLDGISIKAAFSNDVRGLNQRGIMSATTSVQQVPEPSSLLLFGVGLITAAVACRKRLDRR